MNFDWLFYICKVHLNFTKDEFMESTHAEIYKIWMNHVKFNGWKIEDKDDENKSNKERRVYIDEIAFL
ncbi:hypothetical protein AXY43_23120 [Clostridium sp. MF28]|uniref:hypothetical protein n=1 Tax=Clostridium TaxID=1485 RepID=UPI000CF88288|nr:MULTISPECIES: hypothetical protein [Clostridium]AVK50673.1 hypothetical protein AXY43_23120 [Clostridium sp. MF28]PSM58997.1 hypothetical protein C4L39_03825 [Clostridium diolis]